MNILIAGGTGFIGKRLTQLLIEQGHTVTLLSRSAAGSSSSHSSSVRIVGWDGMTPGDWTGEVATSDAVVNLAGESIGGRRWTASRKRKLLESRITSTRAIVEAIVSAPKKPSVFVSASAVGYYGHVQSGDVTESTGPGGDFLSQICVEWEKEALRANEHGVRVALPRTGIVLDPNGGALRKLLLPFRLFAGGPLGSGRQWFPWVHIDDEVGALAHAIVNPSLTGPFNVTAPDYVTMKEFCRALGNALGRPSWAPVPGFVLKMLLGEMAGPLLLSGQKAVSDKLVTSGYAFTHPRLEGALYDLLR